MKSKPEGHTSTWLRELDNIEDRFDSLTRSFGFFDDSSGVHAIKQTDIRMQSYINLTKLLIGSRRYECQATGYHGDEVVERAEIWACSLRMLALEGQMIFFQDAFYVFFTKAGQQLYEVSPFRLGQAKSCALIPAEADVTSRPSTVSTPDYASSARSAHALLGMRPSGWKRFGILLCSSVLRSTVATIQGRSDYGAYLHHWRSRCHEPSGSRSRRRKLSAAIGESRMI